MTLKQLGFHRKPKTPTQRAFDARKDRFAIKSETDYHPEAERAPQAPSYAGMWIDEFSNIGNIKNPLASPME
jgi:hypothetical protein